MMHEDAVTLGSDASTPLLPIDMSHMLGGARSPEPFFFNPKPSASFATMELEVPLSSPTAQQVLSAGRQQQQQQQQASAASSTEPGAKQQPQQAQQPPPPPAAASAPLTPRSLAALDPPMTPRSLASATAARRLANQRMRGTTLTSPTGA